MSLSYNQLLESDLLQIMGAQDVPNEQKEEIYAKALQTIDNRVLARVLDNLTDEEVKLWEEIPDADTKQQADFLTERSIDINKFYAEEAIIYKTELASIIEAGKTAV